MKKNIITALFLRSASEAQEQFRFIQLLRFIENLRRD